MIEVSQLNKFYGNKQVIKDVSFTLSAGGITSIIGPNGAGKSTLLSLISRLLPADSGSVRVDGMNVATTPGPQLAKRLSVLRQENHFVSRLTVKDLVSFGRYPYSQGRLTVEDHEKVNAAMAFLDLQVLQHRFLDQLSGGQRQRAFVAMVLCQETDYVLLDEPLNNLDMQHSVAMMKQIRRAADELQRTVVLVIHDINFAAAYSDRILAMKNGQLIFDGSPQTIMTPQVLEQVFNLPVQIEQINGQPVAVYYR
ncbi:ABC transporter ATP-binding protein [Chromatiaceae bacterium AAb-1]|nr:ABC transporter ATP-binding protein [Chromatiaceae bacterium AAb-1]